MRRLILLMSMSLDGFAAPTNWLTPQDGPDHGDQRHRLNLEVFSRTDTILLGRNAAEEMAPAWSGSDSPMARWINRTPKVVFSQGLGEIVWDNTRITGRAISDEVPELKAADGEDIVFFGGATVGQSLLREGLVDELRLTVHPVALGEGLPLLAGPQRFEMVSATVYADGSVAQTLRLM